MTDILRSIARKRTSSQTVPNSDAKVRAELRFRQQYRALVGKKISKEQLAGLRKDSDAFNYVCAVLGNELND